MKKAISMLTAVGAMAAVTVLMLLASCGKTTNENEAKEQKAPLEIVELQPEFPGGPEALMQYFADSTRYPEQAVADSIEGRVVCRMVIHKDGSVSDVEVLRGVDPLLDAEAIRVIEAMPKWTPGKVKGEAVDAYFSVPVVFRLK